MRAIQSTDLPYGFLLGPTGYDPPGPHRADARHLREALRVSLDDLERLLTEHADDALGHRGPDAPHLTRGEVSLDSITPSRRSWLKGVGLELETVDAIAHPR